jgi:hypothetical protein
MDTLYRLAHHSPLIYSAVKFSGMNVIELAFEDPLLVGVINNEGQVWRDTELN